MPNVVECWKGGYKYFLIDLDDGEARLCLSPCKRSNCDMEAYAVEHLPKNKTFYMDFLRVSPKYRNCGHGSELLKACIRWADISKNIIILDAIPLDSGIEQNRLLRFYLKHGFQQANRYSNRAMFYHNRN